MRLKYPYIDHRICDRALPCSAAKTCPHDAFHSPDGGERGEGRDGGEATASIDYERCRRCGTCELSCKRGAVRMI